MYSTKNYSTGMEITWCYEIFKFINIIKISDPTFNQLDLATILTITYTVSILQPFSLSLSLFLNHHFPSVHPQNSVHSIFLVSCLQSTSSAHCNLDWAILTILGDLCNTWNSPVYNSVWELFKLNLFGDFFFWVKEFGLLKTVCWVVWPSCFQLS
jgi:hypothetical protein